MVAPKLNRDRSGVSERAASEPDQCDNLVGLEGAVEALRHALVEGDGETLSRVLHERLTYSHSNGRVWSKDELLGNIGGNKRYLSISLSEQTVDIAGSVGVVRHTYDVVNNLGDGKTSSGHLGVLQCWVKVEGAWQLLARSGTTLVD